VDREQAFASGRRLTGFMFGHSAVVARLDDKTAEIERRGVSWLPDLWGERDGTRPVWRLEFQFRREVLGEFQLRTVDETLASVQNLWRYGSGQWLTLRLPNGDPRERRWPLDPLWRGSRRSRSRRPSAAWCASGSSRPGRSWSSGASRAT
jgi:hypothetical protein